MKSELLQFWLNLSTDKICKNWSFRILEGLFFRNGLYDTEPLRRTLRGLVEEYKEKFKRKINIGMSDLN